jgi:hypothetical protein
MDAPEIKTCRRKCKPTCLFIDLFFYGLVWCYLLATLVLSWYGLRAYYFNAAGIIPDRCFVDEVLDKTTDLVKFDE